MEYLHTDGNTDSFLVHQTVLGNRVRRSPIGTGRYICHHPHQEIEHCIYSNNSLNDLKGRLRQEVQLFEQFDSIAAQVEAELEDPQDTAGLRADYAKHLERNKAKVLAHPQKPADPLEHHIDLPEYAVRLLTEYDTEHNIFIVYYQTIASEGIQDYERIIKTAPDQEVRLQETTIDALIRKFETRALEDQR